MSYRIIKKQFSKLLLQAIYEIPEKLRPKINSKIQKQQPKVLSLHKKLGFPLRISLVNVTRSFCGFAQISEEIPNEKLHFYIFICI